jgi:2-keto-3-deoxy-L-rhamnonate aldolase RhmA
MKDSRIKQALKEGKVVIGTMITEFRTPEVIRMMAVAGFDFVFIDTEHSLYSLETVIDMVRVAKSLDLDVLVRVPDAEYHLIARTLDAGAQGVMVPRIESVQQVQRIVNAVKYPPFGQRGFGGRAILTDYKKMPLKEQIEQFNKNTMIVLQIERKKAIDDIESLVSINGVDAALIGPNDLSISLGIPGEFTHPTMVEAIQNVVNNCERFHIAPGIHVGDMKTLLQWKDRGMKILTYSTDAALMMSAASEATRSLKSAIR